MTFDDGIFTREGFLAGSDERRLAELRAGLSDPDVNALVAVRGGYGTTRLLDHLSVAEVAASPKLLVGFSDVTALHALWARAGLRSLHGPMVAALGRGEPAWFDRWVAAVEGHGAPVVTGLTTIVRGTAEGPLLGGNLALLAALSGTPYVPPLDGSVLFLEDVGEAPYRVDRMLTTLRQAGWFERVTAVALGMFSRCNPGAAGTTVQEILRDRLSDLSVPVVEGLRAGHEPENLEIPLGAAVRVDADQGTLTFLEEAVIPTSGTNDKNP